MARITAVIENLSPSDSAPPDEGEGEAAAAASDMALVVGAAARPRRGSRAGRRLAAKSAAAGRGADTARRRDTEEEAADGDIAPPARQQEVVDGEDDADAMEVVRTEERVATVRLLPTAANDAARGEDIIMTAFISAPVRARDAPVERL